MKPAFFDSGSGDPSPALRLGHASGPAKGLVVMSEHRIRLRRGWEFREAGSAASDVRRIDLPVRWSATIAERLVLTRRFGRPALKPGRQVLLLEMDQIAGTHAIMLNGHSVGAVSPEIAHYAIELTELAERNVLVLEIDTTSLGVSQAVSGEDWGVIALVIRDTGPALALEGPGIDEQIDLE